MKKLIIFVTTFFFSAVVFSQSLGDYYISKSSAKTKGLSFKIKKPLGYTEFEGKIPTTIVGFSNNSNTITELLEIYISIYALKDWDMEFLQTISKNDIKSIFRESGMEYYELCGLPGWFAEEDNLGHHIQSFTIIGKNLFVIKLGKMSGTLSSREKEFFHKMAKSLSFL